MYCKLFIDTELDREEVSKLIAKSINGIVHKHQCFSEALDIYVNKNDDFDLEKGTEKRDGFLYYKYFLDIEPQKGSDEEVYINTIGKLLENLWRNGIKAVAASDFEHLLPR
uniref:1,4-dihydroxy-6-naphthoate synthase n=1 Tax=Brevibacillus sp. FIR094 TaxID=3134809 RepID=UPI003D21D470